MSAPCDAHAIADGNISGSYTQQHPLAPSTACMAHVLALREHTLASDSTALPLSSSLASHALLSFRHERKELVKMHNAFAYCYMEYAISHT